jgi:hypothetical protein
MKSLTIYDTATGEVKKTIVVPSHHVVKLAEGEAILDGQYDDAKFMVVDGKPVERPMVPVSESHSEPQPVTEADMRKLRNALLTASDWTQVADAPVDQAAWAEYRQALRDLPANTDDPRNVVWPEQPV